MSIAKHSARAALLAATAGTVLAASLTGVGGAQAATLGYSSVESCTGLSGSISWSPGLLKTTVKPLDAPRCRISTRPRSRPSAPSSPAP